MTTQAGSTEPLIQGPKLHQYALLLCTMHEHSQSMLNLHNIITNQITAKLKPFQMKIRNRKMREGLPF